MTSEPRSSPADSSRSVVASQDIQGVMVSEKGLPLIPPASPSPSVVGSRTLENFALVSKSKSKAPVTDAHPGSAEVLTRQVLGETLTNLGLKDSEDLRSPVPMGSQSPVVIAEKVTLDPPPLRGAWTKKLRFSNAEKEKPFSLPKNKFPPEASHEDNVRFPWAISRG